MRQQITLLIDADIVAYKIAATHEYTFDWDDGLITRSTDLDNAKHFCQYEIKGSEIKGSGPIKGKNYIIHKAIQS